MNELPVMPIRAKYADETPNGKNLDEYIDVIDSLTDSVNDLDDKTQKISHSAGGTSVDGNLSAGVIYGSTSVSSPSGAFTELTSTHAKLFENIEDADGNGRFIDGDINLTPSFKGTKEYAKWTLSGSHLMIVCMFKATEDFTAIGTNCASMQLPEWLYNKIYPMGTSNHIAVIDDLYGYNPTNLNASSGSIRPYIGRDATLPGIVITIERGNVEQDKFYRIVFDLVID